MFPLAVVGYVSFWVPLQDSIPMSLSYIILVLMFVVYLGLAGRQPLQGYAAPPVSFIIFNQFICKFGNGK